MHSSLHSTTTFESTQVRLLKAHDTSFQQQCMTGRDGRCVFDALDPDDYYVKFEPPQTSYHFSQAPPGLHTLRMTVLTDDNDDVRLDAPQGTLLMNTLECVINWHFVYNSE